jgi:hypothetical protein
VGKDCVAVRRDLRPEPYHRRLQLTITERIREPDRAAARSTALSLASRTRLEKCGCYAPDAHLRAKPRNAPSGRVGAFLPCVLSQAEKSARQARRPCPDRASGTARASALTVGPRLERASPDLRSERAGRESEAPPARVGPPGASRKPPLGRGEPRGAVVWSPRRDLGFGYLDISICVAIREAASGP